MKVLLINNFHYRKGGSETVYFNTAEILRTNGHEVIHFSYQDAKNQKCAQSICFVRRKGTFGTILDYFYNREAYQKLLSLLKSEKPDVAHVHLFWGGLSASILKALKKSNVPIIHTAHDYRMVCPAYTFIDGNGNKCERCKKWNYYQCALHRCSRGGVLQSIIMTIEMYTRQLFFNPLRYIDGFIFVSNFSERKHIEHNPTFKYKKRIVLYNYTKPIFEPLPLSEKKEYILFYGRLSFEKGIPILLEAASRHKNIKIIIVGTGPQEEELKYNTFDNIEFLGYKTGADLFNLVMQAKFVCVPSEGYENNPMTIVESYSFGTPVIGSNIGGIPEIVNDGETGWLFLPGDTRGLEELLVKASLIKDSEYEKMCAAAYNFYRQNFSEQMHYKKLIQFYKEIVEK